eukprot:403375359
MENELLETLLKQDEEKKDPNIDKDFSSLDYFNWLKPVEYKFTMNDASFQKNPNIYLQSQNFQLDDQGLMWERMRISRKHFRMRRQRAYKSYRNHELLLNSRNQEMIEEAKEPQVMPNNFQFYEHRLTLSEDKINIGHFQLLRNLKAIDCGNVYFASDSGICHANFKEAKYNTETVVLNSKLSGVLSVFDVKDNILVMGTHEGQVYIYDLDNEKYLYEPFVLAVGEGMIVNYLQLLSEVPLLNDQGYKSNKHMYLLSATNDSKVKIHDVEMGMKERECLNFKDPINVAALSPDGNLLAVYGDCYPADIYDRRSSKLVASLQGHEDYGFALQWHPSQNYLATGNQDRTCKLWDVRYLRDEDQFSQKQGRCYCVKTFEGHQGQISEIRFYQDMLIFAESIDYVHIYDTQTYEKHQEINNFGQLSGIDIYEDRLFLALNEPHMSCLMEYKLIQNNYDLYTPNDLYL